MKVTLVHDFLKEFGGAERVLEALHEIWPDAPIYTAFVDYDGLGPHRERIKEWNIRTTWAAQIPFITRLYSPLRFLAPFFFRSLDLEEYDVIISSTNAYYAKGVIKRELQGARQLHICYCHTPPRSLYGYPTAMDWRKNPIIRLYGTVVNHFLRIYDFRAAQAVDYFIANSQEVQRRIKKFYRRESVVIYPPVEVDIKKKSPNILISQYPNIPPYFLYVGKLAFAKHVDLAIMAANKLKVPLKIVGKGAEEKHLRSIARETVEFLGEVNDRELARLYQACKAVIFPAEDEDFGIVPVEAMSFGKPVITFRSGGVLETVVDPSTNSGQATGIFFNELKVDALVNALKLFDTIKFDSLAIKKHAQKFSKERFVKEMTQFMKEKIHARTSRS